MLDGVSGVVVPVTNLAKAQDFYMGKLGIRNKAGTDDKTYVALQAFGQTIFLLAPTPEFPYRGKPGAGSVLMFNVNDLDGTMKELKQRGVEVAAPLAAPGGRRLALLSDPDGNTIGLTQGPEAGRKPRA